MRRPSTISGFTLLEVIMAMALIALVIGGVYGIAQGAVQLGTSMSKARITETRISHFVGAWRDYLENLPPGIVLTAGVEKATRGAPGHLLIEGGSAPFAWNRAVRLADAVEFAAQRLPGEKALQFSVRHLQRRERPTPANAYDVIAELPLLKNVRELEWQFYDAQEERWFSSWDPRKRPQPPLFMRMRLSFMQDPRVHEFTFWIANDLAPPAPSPP